MQHWHKEFVIESSEWDVVLCFDPCQHQKEFQFWWKNWLWAPDSVHVSMKTIRRLKWVPSRVIDTVRTIIDTSWICHISYSIGYFQNISKISQNSFSWVSELRIILYWLQIREKRVLSAFKQVIFWDKKMTRVKRYVDPGKRGQNCQCLDPFPGFVSDNFWLQEKSTFSIKTCRKGQSFLKS